MFKAITEVFDGSKWVEGPRGPHRDKFELGHCLVQINDSHTLLIGGQHHPSEFFIYNWNTQSWTDGGTCRSLALESFSNLCVSEPIPNPRIKHSCIRMPFKLGGEIVVLGGTETLFDVVDIYNPVKGATRQFDFISLFLN